MSEGFALWHDGLVTWQDEVDRRLQEIEARQFDLDTKVNALERRMKQAKLQAEGTRREGRERET